MSALPPLKVPWPTLKNWARLFVDALPPYHVTQGRLESKHSNSHGTGLIKVASATVEVDEATLAVLELGETLRVRYTRGRKAISIDRIRPDNGTN